MRLRAIACALCYGLAPWRLYEDESHYAPMSYLAHLWMNIVHALRWLTFCETDEDWRFERDVNSAP